MKNFMIKQLVNATLTSLLLLCCAATALAGITADVPENKSKLFNLNKPAYRISVANPKIAEFLLLSPTQIQLNGLKGGTTSMIVWQRGEKSPIFFDINVFKDDSGINAKLRELAPNDDITAYFIDDTVVLTGTAKNEDTVKKAIELAGAYAPESDVKINVSEEDGVKVTKTQFNAKVINHIVIHDPNQIMLEVKVAQVDKNLLRNIGVNFNISGGTAGRDGLVFGSMATLGNTFNAFKLGLDWLSGDGDYTIGATLSALATKGMANILAEPNLLVRTGEIGEFKAVKSIPYQVIVGIGDNATPTIEFIDVGVILKFNPEILENGLIRLKIDPAEVSSITGTLEINGYPIIDKKSTKTSVDLRDGESLVIGGLLSKEAINTMSKVPILGDIPILGALFRSTEKDIQEKELVFFITPKLMRPTAPGVKTELPTDKHPTPEEEKELSWIPIP